MLLELIDHIYAAGCDPRQWASFGTRIQSEFPGVGFGALLLVEGAHTAENSVLVGYDPDSLKSFYDHYQHMNPYEPLFKGVPVGKVVKATDITTRGWLKQQPFYHEWLKPAGDYTHGACLVVSRDPRRLMRANFDIPDRLGHLEEPCAQLLTRLRPHFARAFEVNQRLDGAIVTQNLLGGMLDRIDGAAAIVGANARVFAANKRAETLAVAGTLVKITASRLMFRKANDEQAFLHALAAALGAADSEEPCAFAVNDVSIGSAHVLVLPLRAASDGVALAKAKPQALIVIRETAGAATVPSALLRTLHQLSSAEAAIALQIASGATSAEAADILGVSHTTARNQLAAAMAKLNVHRQAELVAVIAALSPRLDVGRETASS